MQCLGSLFIIAAASGTGKTSLAKALAETLNDISVSISYTTRPMRVGEVADRSYFFVDEAKFKAMVEADLFLEHAKVFGFYYGTSRQWVFDKLKHGQDVILDIDWQGAKKVKKACPKEAVSIFLLPPSRLALRQRLETRKRDSEAVMADRLDKAGQEIKHFHEFDYLVINDDFDKALADLKDIIRAHRLQCSRQASKYAGLLEELLKNK